MKFIRYLLLLLVLTSNIILEAQNSDSLPDTLYQLLQQNPKDDRHRIDALGTVIETLRNDDQDEQILPYIQEIFRISELLDDDYGKALGNYFMGVYQSSMGNYKKNYEYLTESQSILSALKKNKENRELLIRTHLALSAYYFEQNMPPEAYEEAQKGLIINEEVKSKELHYKLNNNLGVFYTNMKRYDEAIELFKSMLAEEAVPKTFQSWFNFNIGRIYIEKNESDSALLYLEKAYQLSETPTRQSAILNVIGVYYGSKNDMQKAETYYKRALSGYDFQKDELLFSSLNINLCNIYYLRKDYDSAMYFYNIGMEVAKRKRNYPVIDNGLLLKTKILMEQGKDVEALQCMFERDAWRDTLNELQNMDRLNQLILQREIKTIEAQAMTEKMRQRMNLYLLSAFFFLVVMVVLFLLNRKSILLKKKKAEEKSLTMALDYRNRELTSNVLSQIHRKELLDDIIEKLTSLTDHPEHVTDDINTIVQGLKTTANENSRQDFDYYFVQIHPDFYTKLQTDFPKLSLSELRLCAFIKLNLSTKEIASVNNITIEGVNKARQRLRKNLGLTNSKDSLGTFLSQY